MGCDIHCYIEYAHGTRWYPFGSEFVLNRNYELFGALAGVRSNKDPVFRVRGVPPDMAYRADCEYWMFPGDECWNTRQKAEEYVARGESVWQTAKKEQFSHPDYHTPSWLTCDEFAKVLSIFHDELQYGAVLAAMLHFESAGCKTRIVFWFDN